MEKNRKSRKIAKVALAGVSLMAVSAITFGATMAYLSATTNTKTNTFSASASVDITLTEPSWDLLTEHKIVPGESVDKDPTITNNTGSDTAYVAIGLTFWKESSGAGATTKTYEQISYDEFCTFASLEGFDSTNWTAESQNTTNSSATDKAMVYYYNTTLAESVSTPTLFTSVKFNNDLTGLGLVDGTARYKDIKVTVNAYAVSAEGITDTESQTVLYDLANPTT